MLSLNASSLSSALVTNWRGSLAAAVSPKTDQEKEHVRHGNKGLSVLHSRCRDRRETAANEFQ